MLLYFIVKILNNYSFMVMSEKVNNPKLYVDNGNNNISIFK